MPVTDSPFSSLSTNSVINSSILLVCFLFTYKEVVHIISYIEYLILDHKLPMKSSRVNSSFVSLDKVSCVGAFGSTEFMRRINGEANVTAVNVASEEGPESVLIPLLVGFSSTFS